MELFVMAMGASNYTFAEASLTQQLADFVGSTIRGFEYFGCVPQGIVPDQLRSAIRGTDRYEPDINPTYLEMGRWGTTTMTANKFGPALATVVEQMLARYVIAEQGYRACLGLLRLAERVGASRVNVACERALRVGVVGGPSRKYIEAILKNGLDQESPTAKAVRNAPLTHENVRGGDYYDKEETVH